MTKLIALDIDGTILSPHDEIPIATTEVVKAIENRGDVVMLATGRSLVDTAPIAERLDIRPEFLVCSNGAVIAKLDGDTYRPWHVETFDPTPVLEQIRNHLGDVTFAVESTDGAFRYFGDDAMHEIASRGTAVPFDELVGEDAIRVVVISPNHDQEDFLRVVEEMGLHRVSYAVGWTAWLDIAPEGVNKGTALEWVRNELEIDPVDVVVAGDGRNDIEMFEWAVAGGGTAFAMGQAPEDVQTAANRVAEHFDDAGLAKALREV